MTHLWDLRSEPPFRRVDFGPAQKAYPLLMSPGGRWLLTIDISEGAARFDHGKLWDLSSGDPSVRPIDLGLKQPASLPLSSSSVDGNWLALCRLDATGYVWDLRKAHDKEFGPAELAKVPAVAGSQPVVALNCEFSLAGGRLVVTLSNATARLYDPAAPSKEPTTVDLHAPGLTSHRTVLTDQRGRWVVTTAVRDGPSASVATGTAGARDVPPPGAQVLVPGPPAGPGSGEQVYLWDLSSATLKAQPVLLSGFVAPRDRMNFIQIDPGGRRLLVNADDGRFLLWNLKNSGRTAGGSAAPASTGILPVELRLRDLGDPGINSVLVREFTISRDGRWVAARVGSTGFKFDSRPYVWDLETRVLPGAGFSPMMLRGHEGAVTALAFSQDCRHLVTTSEDSTSRIWDLADLSPSAQPFKVQGPAGGPPITYPGVLSKDRRWLAVVRSDGVVELTDLAKIGKPNHPTAITAPGSRARIISSVDGRWLVVSADDRDVILLDLTSDDPPSRPIALPGLRIVPFALVADPQGHWFAATTSEPASDPRNPANVAVQVRLWKLAKDRKTVRARRAGQGPERNGLCLRPQGAAGDCP